MKKVLLFLLSLIMVLSMASCKSVIGDGQHRFTYFSGGKEYSSTMYYNDDYFYEESIKYNPQLSTASLSFAMACFASTNKNYQYRSENGVALLSSLGFIDIETNDYYKKKPTADSFGVIIGNKKDIDGATLLAVGTRGANYEAEWASNFTLCGKDDLKYHQGFYEGSTIDLNFVCEYINTHNITGRIKIWTSGYSRAGAVTNLFAGRLDEAIKDNKSLLPESVTLKKEDLYAYCFEAPQGVKREENSTYPKSEAFNNIYCIINYNDPVPKVAMSVFNYTRYGVDIVLSDYLTNLDHDTNLETIIKHYNSLDNAVVYGDYRINNFSMTSQFKIANNLISLNNYSYWTQALFLESFITDLSLIGVENLNSYGVNLQEGLRDTFVTLYEKGSLMNSLVDLGITIARKILLSNDASIIMDDLLHNHKALIKDLKPLLAQALSTLGINADADNISTGITNFIEALGKTLFNDTSILPPMLSKENILDIGSAHYPELCLSHLRAMDINYTDEPIEVNTDGRYYIIELTDIDNHDIDVFYKGESIVKVDNDIIYANSGYKIPVKSGFMARVCLPYNYRYEINLNDNEYIDVYLYDPNQIDLTTVDIKITGEKGEYKFSL